MMSESVRLLVSLPNHVEGVYLNAPASSTILACSGYDRGRTMDLHVMDRQQRDCASS